MSVLRSVRACGAVLLLLLGTAKVEAQPAQDSVPAASRYAATAAMLARFVASEMADKKLPAAAFATPPRTCCATTCAGTVICGVCVCTDCGRCGPGWCDCAAP